MDKRKSMEEVMEEPTLQSEDISQKKPFWENSKGPIVVALVVVVLGILGVGINLYLKTITPLPPTPSLPFLKEVTITTDKTEYAQEEKVKITISNNSKGEKWTYSPFYTVEGFNDGTWVEIKRVLCPCGVSCRMATHFVLDSDKPLEFEWDQKETWCSDSMGIPISEQTISQQVPPGRYRIKSEISDPSEDGSRETIYSNEFRIKEK